MWSEEIPAKFQFALSRNFFLKEKCFTWHIQSCFTSYQEPSCSIEGDTIRNVRLSHICCFLLVCFLLYWTSLYHPSWIPCSLTISVLCAEFRRWQGVLWCLCAWQNRQCFCRQGLYVKSKLHNFRQNWNMSTEIIQSLGLLFEATNVFGTTDPHLGPNHCTAVFFLSLWILQGQAATRQRDGLDFSLMWPKEVPMCWWVWLAAAWAVSPPAAPL